MSRKIDKKNIKLLKELEKKLNAKFKSTDTTIRGQESKPLDTK